MGEENISWEYIVAVVDQAYDVISRGLSKNWYENYRDGLVEAFHRIIDVREALRI